MEHDPAGERLGIRETRPGCLVATIDNPPINLLDPDLYAELWALLDRMERDDLLRVVVFESANPDYFIAHLNARRIGEAPKRPGAVPVEQTWPEFVERFARTVAVSIASIRGRHAASASSSRSPATCASPAPNGRCSACPRSASA